MRHRKTKLYSGLTLVLAASVAQADHIRVHVDGVEVHFANQGPMMIGQRVCVPLRGVFERLGATVVWDADNQTVTCEKQSRMIWLRIGDRNARVDQQDVWLDQPAVLYRGTTMVPIRFVSESLGAEVRWNEALQAVNITSAAHAGTDLGNTDRTTQDINLPSGTVLPVTLDQDLSSSNAKVGDQLSATIGSSGSRTYAGLPAGSMVHGRVTVVKPKTRTEPGLLAVDFDTVMTPNGKKYAMNGSVIDLNDKSVEYKDGMIVAKDSRSSSDHKSVWIGAGAGAIVALVTKNNLLAGTVIGAGLGYLYEQLGLGGSKSNDVRLAKGSAFGVKMDSDFYARIDR